MPFYCNLGGKLSICMYSWSIKIMKEKMVLHSVFVQKKNERNFVTKNNRCTPPPPTTHMHGLSLQYVFPHEPC